MFTLLDVGLGLQADGDSPTVCFIVKCDQDTEGVTVRDLVVDEALQVNCLQLEVDGDVDQLVEFQCDVLVTGAAIQEVQVLTGDVRRSVRRIHLDTVSDYPWINVKGIVGWVHMATVVISLAESQS